MLTFRKDLIVGESLKGKERKIVPNIKRGKIKKKGVTLITYAANGKDLFDLIPAQISVRAAGTTDLCTGSCGKPRGSPGACAGACYGSIR